MAELEVSRRIVREALHRLRDQGLIHSRCYADSFLLAVRFRPPLYFGTVENMADVRNCYEFRLTVGLRATAYAATRHNPQILGARLPWHSR